MKFPYVEYSVEPSPTLPNGIIYRPMLPIRVIGPAGEISILGLLDTGSDQTLLPRTVGNDIGANIDNTQQWSLGGVGGQSIHAVLGRVELEIAYESEAYRWPQQVGFVSFATAEDEVAILGHAGFLDFFTVTFDGENHEFSPKSNQLLPKK